MVKVVLPSLLAQVTNGEGEVSVSGATLNEALIQLVTRYGDPFKTKILDLSGNPKRFLNIYLNGRNVVFIKNLDTPLTDGDVVTILPSASGG